MMIIIITSHAMWAPRVDENVLYSGIKSTTLNQGQTTSEFKEWSSKLILGIITFNLKTKIIMNEKCSILLTN